MSTTTLKFVTGPRVQEQRGARIGAQLFVAAWQVVASLFTVTPRVRSRAEEAAEVREMARGLHASDPGFASDLLAAADRHETTAK